MVFNLTHFAWAFLLGTISAASLPLGSWIGLITKPKVFFIGFLAAFGAGALFAALAVELVAPTVTAVTAAESAAGLIHDTDATLSAFIALIAGSIIGCISFVVLDQLVNAHGGFLRKSATTMAWFGQRKKQRQIGVLRDLSCIDLFQSVPEAAIQDLVDLVKPVHFNKNEVLFNQGEEGEELFFIRDGEITLYHDGQKFKTLGKGTVLGEMALLTGAPRNNTAVSTTVCHCLMLCKESFDQLRGEYPAFDQSAREMVSERLDELTENRRHRELADEEWARKASKALRTGLDIPSTQELREAHEQHSGAPMAIWLGILLDGMPESFVIGTGLTAILVANQGAGLQAGFADVVPYTLIAGLFLSNFPEALSSSVGMKQQGMKHTRIFILWFSLMLMTGIGAALGYLLSGALSHTLIVGIEGVAAGAMLTMIAAAMIPEAAHRSGPVASGVGTMLGFIAAVSFKLLE